MSWGFCGSIASAPMLSVGWLCHNDCQLRPPSGECHTPPPAAPAHSRSGSVGWQTALVIRPPMFDGPTGSHCCTPGAGGTSSVARVRSRISSSTGDSRSGQASRARNHPLRTLWVVNPTIGRFLPCGPGRSAWSETGDLFLRAGMAIALRYPVRVFRRPLPIAAVIRARQFKAGESRFNAVGIDVVGHGEQ